MTCENRDGGVTGAGGFAWVAGAFVTAMLDAAATVSGVAGIVVVVDEPPNNPNNGAEVVTVTDAPPVAPVEGGTSGAGSDDPTGPDVFPVEAGVELDALDGAGLPVAPVDPLKDSMFLNQEGIPL